MNKIILTYFSFLIASTVVIAAFITATSYIQIGVAALLYLLLALFAYLLFAKSPKKQPAEVSYHSVEETPAEATNPQPQLGGIADIDKREFLKLIGGAGLFLFFFSIL